MTTNSAPKDTRLEIGSFARFGDIIDSENEVVAKIKIPKGLQESESVDAWVASLDDSLAKQGYKRTGELDAKLPFTRQSALKRHVVTVASA